MKRGHVPIRTCRGCGKKAPKSELVRFVLDQGRLVEDDRGRGYGVYCCPAEVCRDKARTRIRKHKRN
ncbi:MAG: hypothetical protein Kow0089_14250 [Desulfobulbaceae bacterium]